MKEFKSYSITPESNMPSEDELSLINNYTVKSVTADEVFTFSVILCDNAIDRDGECFTLNALNYFCEKFVGVTGLFDHSMSTRDQTARIYKTEIITDSTKSGADGTAYTALKAYAYIPRIEENNKLISDISCGIKKEVSISFKSDNIICSECGKSLTLLECSHIKGKTCYGIIDNPSDVYEWSFVAVPAQRNAGVTKSFDVLSKLKSAENHITLSTDEAAELLSLAGEAKKYREKLIAETVSIAKAALPDISTELLSTALKTLSSDGIETMKKSFSAAAEKHMPLISQLCDIPESSKYDSSNNAFII